MDAERMSRLGGLVGIGIASQISSQIMQSKSSAHSFWLLVALSLAMVVIQTLTDALVAFRSRASKTATGRNFSGWLLTLVQTLSGVETIVWTLYVGLRVQPCSSLAPLTVPPHRVMAWVSGFYASIRISLLCTFGLFRLVVMSRLTPPRKTKPDRDFSIFCRCGPFCLDSCR